MYHHLDNGEVEFSTTEIVPDQHTTINNKSQVTVTPISLGEITLQWCGVAQQLLLKPQQNFEGAGIFCSQP